MNETLQFVLCLVSIIGAIGGFLIWHFKEMRKLENQIQDLKLMFKDLEKKDELQQQTIDQWKELFPILKDAVQAVGNQTKQKQQPRK